MDCASCHTGEASCINALSSSSSSETFSLLSFNGSSCEELLAPAPPKKRPHSVVVAEEELEEGHLDRRTQYMMANELRRKRVNVFLRILKRDIRRDIPVMLANTWNSADCSTIQSFFQHFCVADCRSVDYAQLSFLSHRLPFKISEGRSQVASRFIDFMPYVPDFVFQILESSIHVQLGVPGSKLVIKSIMHGTRQQDSVVDVVDQYNRVHSMPSYVYSALCNTEAAAMTNAVVYKSVPYKVDIQSTITLTLDDENRVHRVILDHNSIAVRCE